MSFFQARNAKQHVDRLKEKVRGALQQKLSSKCIPPGISHTIEVEPGDDVDISGVQAMVEDNLELEHKFTSAFEAWGCESSRTVEMLKHLQEGVVMQKEHQEKLVKYWLGQHEVMKGELELMLNMANAASQVCTCTRPNHAS